MKIFYSMIVALIVAVVSACDANVNFNINQTFVLTFDKNDLGDKSETTTQILKNGIKSKLKKNSFSITGKTFLGWAKYRGGPVVHSDMARISIAQDMTLYAIWKDNQAEEDPAVEPFLAITFDPNGGKGVAKTQVFRSGVAQAFGENTFTFSGKTFLGWSESKAAREASYGDKFLFTWNGTVTQSLTLYAVWKDVPADDDPADEDSAITVSQAIEEMKKDPNAEISLKIKGTKIADLHDFVRYHHPGPVNLDLSEMTCEKFDIECPFMNCASIKSVILPKTLKSLGTTAFGGADMLEEVVLPEGLERIENEAFYCCFALKKLIIPASVKYIGRTVVCWEYDWQNPKRKSALKEVVFENQSGWYKTEVEAQMSGEAVDVSDSKVNIQYFKYNNNYWLKRN